MIPTHCELCLNASVFLECSKLKLTNVTSKSCLCPWTVALLTERAVTAHSPDWHILPLVQLACLAAQKMDEEQNKVLSLGNAVHVSSCDLNAIFFFACPWGCGTMSLTDMCHLWWHECRRNVLFWLQACKSSCNPFPALPIDWLIRALLPQSPFLLSAKHSHGELRSQLMDAAPGDVCGCSVSWVGPWGCSGSWEALAHSYSWDIT